MQELFAKIQYNLVAALETFPLSYETFKSRINQKP